MPVLILSLLLSVEPPASGLGKQLRMDQSFGTLHSCQRPEEVLVSQLHVSSAPVFATAWGINGWKIFLSVSLPLHIYTYTYMCTIKINLKK